MRRPEAIFCKLKLGPVLLVKFVWPQGFLEVAASACRRNWITLYRWVGGKLCGCRVRLRSFAVSKAAHAAKLMHPNSKTNLIIVLLAQNPISLMPGYDRSTRHQE
jgi:hypothetical protein